MSASRSVALTPSTLAARSGGTEFTAARTPFPASRLQCCKLRISSGLCFSWELQVHFKKLFFLIRIDNCLHLPTTLPRDTVISGDFTENAKGAHFRGAEEGAHRPGCPAEPAPARAAVDPGCLPARRAPCAPPARPPFHLMCRGVGSGAACSQGRCDCPSRWAALLRRWRAAGDAVAHWSHHTGSDSAGQGLVSSGSGKSEQ